jgi:hypothetical protein
MSKKLVLLAVIAALSLCAVAKVEKSQARAGVKCGGMRAVAFGGVTNIKEIVNRTSGVVRIRTVDVKGTEHGSRGTRDIPANGVWTGDIWVPWANNEEEFQFHRMEIVINIPQPTRSGTDSAKFFLIWQSGEYVRFIQTQERSSFESSKRLFVDNAPRVPGEARAGGERRMIVSTKDNQPVLTFENYKP